MPSESPTASVGSPFFVTGGTLPPDASSYVERAADRDLLSALLAREYCYVLNSRQMGKSSLSVRTMGKLQEAGVRTAFIDLTRIGAQNVSPEQWYAGLLSETGRALGLRAEFLQHWKERLELPAVQRYFSALREVGLKPTTDDTDEHRSEFHSPSAPSVSSVVKSSVVLFVDEIDAVRSLSFSADEFFAAVRAFHNARTEDAVYRRLTFCLVGSATPSDLIADTRMSPFNVGRRIELRDFTRAECGPLAIGLNHGGHGGHGEHGERLLDRVYYWTNGHPYLTQSLCQALVELPPSVARNPSSVDDLVRSLFLEAKARERNPNLADVSNRILATYLDADRRDEHRAAVLDHYASVWRRPGAVEDDETNPLTALLKLAGIVRGAGGRLSVRNRIYERVFDRGWMLAHMPDAELRRQKTAYRRGLLRAGLIAAAATAVLGTLTAIALRKADIARINERLANREQERARGLANTLSASLIETKQALAAAAAARNEAQKSAKQATAEKGRADSAAQTAKEQRDLAIRHAGEARAARRQIQGSLVEARVSDGFRLVGEGDRLGAANMFVEALQLDREHPENEASHRDRIAAALVGAPRLEQALFCGSPVNQSRYSPDGSRILTATEGGEAQIWDAASGARLVSIRPGGPVMDAEWSPDGRYVATACADKTARVWYAANGRAFSPVIRCSASVVSATWSPDGRRVAFGHDGVTVLDVIEKEFFHFAIGGMQNTIASFSPDGRHLLYGGGNYQTHLLDVQRGEGLPLRYGAWAARGAAFSPDGRRFAVSAAIGLEGRATTNGVQMFRTDDGRRDGSLVNAPSGGILRWSPDGKLLVHGSQSGVVQIITVGGPESTRYRHGGAVRALTFSPDGREIASAGDDGVVEIRDAQTGARETAPVRQVGGVRSIEFGAGGRRLLTSGADQTVRVWDLSAAAFGSGAAPGSGERERSAVRQYDTLETMPVDNEGISPVALLLPGRKMLLFSHGEWLLRDLATGRNLLPTHAGASVGGAAIRWRSAAIPPVIGEPQAPSPKIDILFFLGQSADGSSWAMSWVSGRFSAPVRIAFAGVENALRVPVHVLQQNRVSRGYAFIRIYTGQGRFWESSEWIDTRTWRVISSRQSGEKIASVAWEGHVAACLRADGQVQLRTFPGLAPLGRPFKPPVVPEHMHLSARGDRLALIGPSGDALCDASGRVLARIDTGSQSVYGAEVNDREAWFFSADTEILDRGTGKRVVHLAHAATFHRSPDGSRLIVVGGGRTRLYDTKGFRLLRDTTFPIGPSPVRFRFDGAVYAYATGTGEVRLCDRNGRQRFVMPHPDPVTHLAFSASGRRLASSCMDGFVRIWDTQTGRLAGPPFRGKGMLEFVGEDELFVNNAYMPSPPAVPSMLVRLPHCSQTLEELRALLALTVGVDARGGAAATADLKAAWLRLKPVNGPRVVR